MGDEICFMNISNEKAEQQTKDSEPRRDNPSLSCSYLNEKYGGEGKYVPARIVALYKDPLTGTRPWCKRVVLG